MAAWGRPPIAKIFEALTAVADGRVKIVGNRSAEVVSSDGAKTYTVTWNDDRSAFGSNDNASYWQGYLGYPIIATLMALGIVEYEPQTADKLAHVPWKKLNDAAKRDYNRVIAGVLDGLGKSDAESVNAEVERIKATLDRLTLAKIASPPPPTRRKP